MTSLDSKIALRTIYRNKIFSFINVLGLAIGISVAIVACLLVSYDFSFEKSQKDGDRIYRIVSWVGVEPNILYTPGVPMPLGDEVRTRIPGVESASAIGIINDPEVTIPVNEQLHTFSRQKGVILQLNL